MAEVLPKRYLYLTRQLHQQLIIKVAKVINHMSLDSKLKTSLSTLKWLDQVQFVEFVFDDYQGDTRQKLRLSELRCEMCDSQIHNIFLLLIHINTVHEIQNFKFQIQQGNQLLSILKQPKLIKKESYQQGHKFAQHLFIDDYYKRMSDIIMATLSKITRKELPQSKTIFYHSTDIFRQIIKSDSDSQQDLYDIVHHNQIKKLQEFTDVSKQQIQFFTAWNNFIRKLQKNIKTGVFGKEHIVNNLKQFIKLKQISSLRVQLITHLNALWSYGLMDAEQIIKTILQYDQEQKSNKGV